MICYFWEDLKSSINVKIKQQDREYLNFEEMVQRAVNPEAKAGLRSSTIVRDLDTRCPRGHRPSHATLVKVQTQGFNTKEFKSKDFKPKKSKSAKDKILALLRSKSTESEKTSHTNKKRSILRRNEIGKTISWQLEITLILLRAERSGTIKMTGGVTITKKRDIFWKIARNLHKTSVSFGNLHAGNLW